MSRDLPTSLAVKEVTGRGRGLFASKDFAEGERIFDELPLVAMQHVANARAVEACSQCFRHVGTASSQIRRLLARHPAHDLVPEAMPCETEGFRRCPGPFSCRRACGVVFCGEACEALAWHSWHRLLCPCETLGSGSARREKVLAFASHAEQSNEAFLLAARAAALVCSACLAQGSWDLAWSPFAHLQQPVWWYAVAFTEVDGDEQASRLAMREVLVESWQLLRDLFCSEHPDLAATPIFVDEAVYARLMGMFERNNCSMLVASPVEDYFLYIDTLPEGPAKDAVVAITGPLLDALGEAYATPVEGAGLFPAQAMLNHSCAPNVSFMKGDDDTDGRVVISASRDIRAGEELVHSYIAEGLTFTERLEALRDYAFVCTCEVCTSDRLASGMMIDDLGAMLSDGASRMEIDAGGSSTAGSMSRGKDSRKLK